MTRIERLKLAKAARGLAIECVAGTAPEFGKCFEWIRGKPGCANGHVLARAGFRPTGRISCLADKFWPSWWLVAMANDGDTDSLPWALLSMADELESQP